MVHATIDESITRETGCVIANGKESFEYVCENMPYYLESLEGVDLTFLESELRDAVKSAISFSCKDKLFGINASSFANKYGGKTAWACIHKVESLKSNEAFLLTIKETKKANFISGDIKRYNSLRIVSTCYVIGSRTCNGEHGITNAEGEIYVNFNIENIIVYPDGTLRWGIDDDYQITYSSVTMDGFDWTKNGAIWYFSDDYNIQQLEKDDWLDL